MMGRPELCNVPLWTGSRSIQSDPSGYCTLPRGHMGDHTISQEITNGQLPLDIDLSVAHDPYDLWKPLRDLPRSQDDVW